VSTRTEGIVIASKVGGDPNPNGPIPIKPAQRPEQLRASVEDNLRSLGLDQISVVNLRRLGTPSQLGLAWLLAHAPNVLLIPGTANRHHLEQNMDVASVWLDQDTVGSIDALALQS
jgi:aryl-alcohol dehydrogenase-like predicted oxidoreductase